MNPSLYLVVGLGKTGLSIARYLQRRQQPFVLFDTRQQPAGVAEFTREFHHVDIFLGEIPESVLMQVTSMIVSPGVALEHPRLQQAITLGIPILGDIECFAREVQAPVIAITGTNGKSTVTTLVGEMAREAGLKAVVAGNIGIPVLDSLDEAANHCELWVLELSSFQLELTHSLKPLAATILNITPDHLDRHHTLAVYIQAKQRIYHHAEHMIFNREDELTRPEVEATAVNPQDFLQNGRTSFGLDTPHSAFEWGIVTENHRHYLARGHTKILAVDELRIKGRHNWANALAACALADAAGISEVAMINVLRQFAGLPHRSQWVRTLNEVDWINDSKGTNIGATVSAIAGIGSATTGKIILIMGGQGKGADFKDLRPTMQQYVRTAILIGEDADKINLALQDMVPMTRAATLAEAVIIAREQAKAGDVVLLSPACASFDMFRDFNHRGEVFAAAVAALC